MTTYNKTTLKTFFQQGDIPTGTNYADFIDSNVNLVETAIQNMGGPLSTTELITPRVSAGFVNCDTFGNSLGSSTLTAANRVIIQASSDRVEIKGGTNVWVSAESDIELKAVNEIVAEASSGNVTITSYDSHIFLTAPLGIDIDGDVSANNNTVYASAVRSTRGLFSGVGIVSAAGTTQGAAAILTNVINRGKGVADGTATGFAPLANRAGLVQYLYNEGASANLWPPTGGTINGLAANAAFSLAASAMVTIVHLTASAYAVK